MRGRVACALVGLAVAGCHGPLATPSVERLSDEEQQRVDDAWANLLTQPEPVERSLLLDCILVKALHQYGVDHLLLLSEKRVGDELVVMEVRFDRQDPEGDAFAITHVDADGYEIRRETFTRDDIDARLAFLFTPTPDPNSVAPDEAAAIQARRLAQATRFEEIGALLAPLAEPEQPAAEGDAGTGMRP